MEPGDLLFIGIVLILVVSVWVRLPKKARYPDEQRDDASLDRKRAEFENDVSGGGGGGD